MMPWQLSGHFCTRYVASLRTICPNHHNASMPRILSAQPAVAAQANATTSLLIKCAITAAGIAVRASPSDIMS